MAVKIPIKKMNLSKVNIFDAPSRIIINIVLTVVGKIVDRIYKCKFFWGIL